MAEKQMKLKGLRVERGITQEKMAEQIGMSQSQYAQRELGKVEFTLTQMRNIGRILDIKPGDIFFADE